MKVTPKKIDNKKDNITIDKSKTAKKPKKEKVKFKFFKAIWLVIKGENENTDFTSGIFAYFLSVCFNFLAVLGGIVTFTSIVTLIKEIFTMQWTFGNIAKNSLNIMIFVGIASICFLMSVMLRGAANEIEREKDRNFVIAVFSAVVSFAALIIAFAT